MITRFDDSHVPSFQKKRGLFIVWGILLLVLGLLALSATMFTTLLSVMLIGVIILASGIIIGIDALSYQRGWGNFFIHLLVALLYIAVGLLFLFRPIQSSISLTLFLGILFIIVGFMRLIFSASVRLPNWGWQAFNGILTLILGILILDSWPASSLFVIGLFVGIDLVFCGIGYLMVALAARQLITK